MVSVVIIIISMWKCIIVIMKILVMKILVMLNEKQW